jgi:hypothetical protein
VRRIVMSLLVPLVAAVAVSGCAVTVAGRAVPEPGSARKAERTALVAGVVEDECLLDATGFAQLLGAPVLPPANSGSPPACGTTTRTAPPILAAINVYGVRGADPAALLRTGRALDIGEAAAVVDTAGGPTLQIATGTYLVTIAVADHEPPDEMWITAGRAAVESLGHR